MISLEVAMYVCVCTCVCVCVCVCGVRYVCMLGVRYVCMCMYVVCVICVIRVYICVFVYCLSQAVNKSTYPRPSQHSIQLIKHLINDCMNQRIRSQLGK